MDFINANKAAEQALSEAKQVQAYEKGRSDAHRALEHAFPAVKSPIPAQSSGTTTPLAPHSCRTYAATLLGDYLDIRGQQATYPDVYASDRYDGSQKFGEDVRASGGVGILYTSLRRQTGINVVAFRTHNITDIVQDEHFENRLSDRSDNQRPQAIAIVNAFYAISSIVGCAGSQHPILAIG